MRRWQAFWKWRRQAVGDASSLVLQSVATPGPDVVLALGLQWHAVLGADLPAQARRRARQVGAGQWVHGSERSESVGTATLPAWARRRGAPPIHAAAQALARRFPHGLIAAAVALDDGRRWVAVVRDGLVVGTGDRVYPDADQAVHALRDLVQRHGPALRLVGQAAALIAGEANTDPTGQRDEAPPLAFSDLLAELGPGTRLQSVGTRWRDVPMPLAVAGTVVLVAWTGSMLKQWGWWFRPSVPATVAQAAPPADDLWRAALDETARTLPHPDVAALHTALAALAALPRQPAGWAIQRADCTARAAGGWSCRAHFRRATRLATNAGFLAHAWPQWQLHWEPLDEVVARFSVDGAPRVVSWSTLKAREHWLHEGVTRLQRIAPVFSRIGLAAPIPVPVREPRDAAGQPVPLPVGLPAGFSGQAVTLDGPMRSMTLVGQALSEAVAWRALEMRFEPQADAGPAQSLFMATLQGTIYAIP